MPRFLVEREIPRAGELSPAELRGISRRSVGVLHQLGPDIRWVQSHVTADGIYCIYVAPDEEMVREHARLSGLPCRKVSLIMHSIDSTTAE